VKYNMLTVENEDIGVSWRNKKLWLCRCDCGTPMIGVANEIRSGHTKSCGCQRNVGHPTHGHRARNGLTSKVYSAWCNLRNRCDSVNNPQYSGYGGRGITYDPRWKKFANFFEDMGEPPNRSYSIDRIDNDGPYTKANCRWADKSVQRRNKRPESKGGRLVWCEINGERLILTDAVKKYGVVPYHTAVSRLFYGWTPKDAVLTPYTRGFAHTPNAGKRYELNGKNQTLGEWSKETGIGRVTMLKRIQAGIPLEQALTVKGFLGYRRDKRKV
jgi:hypothetical protein